MNRTERIITAIIAAMAMFISLVMPAQAQTITGPAERAVVYVRGAAPACWPAKTSTGWAVATAETEYGWITGWWCADGTWEGTVVARNPLIDPLHAAYLQAALTPALDALRPVIKPWRVAPNGTATTRPAYTLRDGKLYAGTTRATVGDPCNCALGRYSTSASTVYCAIPQTPSELPLPQVTVAVCRAN